MYSNDLINNRTRGFEVHKDYDPADINIPSRGTKHSAGYDLRICENVVLEPGERKLVPTGLTAYMQYDEELQIRVRSSLANKKGLVVLNAPGTIDADYYPNHIQIILANLSDKVIEIQSGDRVAQAIFSKYLITDGDDYNLGELREGGFGSTGSK